MINSRTKGCTGEREFANWLKERGIKARRGQQFSGSPDSPDVVTELVEFHFEVKRTEHGNPYKWLSQAKTDAKATQTPIVAHRRNRDGWIAILDMNDLINLIKQVRYADCYKDKK